MTTSRIEGHFVTRFLNVTHYLFKLYHAPHIWNIARIYACSKQFILINYESNVTRIYSCHIWYMNMKLKYYWHFTGLYLSTFYCCIINTAEDSRHTRINIKLLPLTEWFNYEFLPQHREAKRKDNIFSQLLNRFQLTRCQKIHNNNSQGDISYAKSKVFKESIYSF